MSKKITQVLYSTHNNVFGLGSMIVGGERMYNSYDQ